MTTPIRNEAAERLRYAFTRSEIVSDEALEDLEQALAAERRATLNRVRTKLIAWGYDLIWKALAKENVA